MSAGEPTIETRGRIAILTLDHPPANTLSVTALSGRGRLAHIEQDRAIDRS